MTTKIHVTKVSGGYVATMIRDGRIVKMKGPMPNAAAKQFAAQWRKDEAQR